MLKFGKITNIDYEAGRAKVQFDDNNIVSKYLPITVDFSLNDSQTFNLDINTPVWCIMDEHLEDGVIGGAIYNKNTLPKGGAKNVFSQEFSDGTRISYNKETHVLKATIQDSDYTITRNGFAIKRGSETLKKIISDLIDAILAETHSSPVGPTGTPLNATQYNGIKNRLSDLFTE